jgi:hypothetical protein
MAAASTAPARPASTAPARKARPTTRPTSRSRASRARAARTSATRTAPRGRARPARRNAVTPMPALLVPLAVGRTAVAVSGLADSGLVHRLTRGGCGWGADHASRRDRLPERAGAELQRLLEQGGRAGGRAGPGDLGLAGQDRHQRCLQRARSGGGSARPDRARAGLRRVPAPQTRRRGGGRQAPRLGRADDRPLIRRPAATVASPATSTSPPETAPRLRLSRPHDACSRPRTRRTATTTADPATTDGTTSPPAAEAAECVGAVSAKLKKGD